MSKRCLGCKQLKDDSKFRFNPNTTDKLNVDCNICLEKRIKVDRVIADIEQAALGNKSLLTPGINAFDGWVVYFVYAPEVERVKIGITGNALKRRLAALQVGSPVKLYMLGAIDGAEEREQQLHSQFAADRVQGEWFSLTQGLREFINATLTKPKWPGKQEVSTGQTYLSGLSPLELSNIERQLRGKRA